MNRRAITGSLIVWALVATPAAADVTFTQKMSGKSMMGALSGESIQQIKGTRMRSDQTIGGEQTSTIIDVQAQQMIVLNHRKREAELYDMTQVAAELAKVPMSDVTASINPTSQTRQIAGSTCVVHDMRISVPMDMGAGPMTIAMSGPVCLARNGPGQADFSAFYQAAAEKGLFFGDPRQARAQPAQARGMTALYREMAALGVPLSQELHMKFEGGGPMASMMAKMGGNVIASEVVSVSTDPIPDSAFEVPAGYKVNRR